MTLAVSDLRTGTPAEQMREQLMRMRQVGKPFDEAFELAFARVKWPHDTEARVGWKAIIAGQQHHYRKAYYLMIPPRSAEAARALVAA